MRGAGIVLGVALGIAGTASYVAMMAASRQWFDALRTVALLAFPGMYVTALAATLAGVGNPHGGLASFPVWMFLTTVVNAAIYSALLWGLAAMASGGQQPTGSTAPGDRRNSMEKQHSERSPYSVGQRVVYRPSLRGRTLNTMTDLAALVPGQEYRITRIEKDAYLVLEGLEASPTAGIHWTEFAPPDPTPDR